jgi:hypothetical protein
MPPRRRRAGKQAGKIAQIVAKPFTDAEFRAQLKILGGYDGDERCMAIQDMTGAILAEGKLRPSIEPEVTRALYNTMLTDKLGDAKAAASKYFRDVSLLYDEKVLAQKVLEMVDFVAVSNVRTKDQLRYLPPKVIEDELATKREVAMTVKYLVKNRPHIKEAIGNQIATKMLQVLERKQQAGQTQFDIEIECLSILSGLFSAGIKLTESEVKRTKQLTLPLLEHKNDTLRNSASATLGPLATVLEDSDFNALVVLILRGMNVNNPQCRAYVAALNKIVENAGSRVAPSAVAALDAILVLCAGEEPTEENFSLWEDCLGTLSLIVHKCPSGLDAKKVEEVVGTILTFLEYDPFFDPEAAAAVAAAANEEDDSMWTTGDYAAADTGTSSSSVDETWKIRRAAANALTGVMLVRKDMLKQMFGNVAAAVQKQFSEREELVRSDMFRTMSVLVKETYIENNNDTVSVAAPSLVRQNSLGNMFMEQVQSIAYASAVQFSSSDFAAKTAIVDLYQQMILSTANTDTSAISLNFAPYYEEEYLCHDGIIAHLQEGLVSTDEKAIPLAISSLRCLQSCFDYIDYSYLEPFIMDLLTNIAGCISVATLTTTALDCFSAAIKQVAPTCDEETATWIASAVVPSFQTADVALEPKLAAIRAMSTTFAYLGDLVTSFLSAAIPVYVNRLQGLTSAAEALKGLTSIAESKSSLDLSPLLRGHASVLSELVAKAIPRLPHTALVCMGAVVVRHPTALQAQDLQVWTDSITLLLSDDQTDPSLSQYALLTCSSLLNCRGASSIISKKIMSRALALTQSPYTSGATLSALSEFFKACVASGARERNMQFDRLKTDLMSRADSKSGLTAIYASSRCLAAIISASGDVKSNLTSFINEVRSSNELTAQVALYTLSAAAEINLDLSVFPNLQATTLQLFDHKSAAVQTASANALGGICSNDPNSLLTLLDSAESGKLFLYITALRVAIVKAAGNQEDAKNFAGDAFETLSRFLANTEPGVPGLLAECLGRLCVLDSSLYSSLLSLLSRASSASRIAAQAIRYSFTDKTDYAYFLANVFPEILPFIADESKENMALKADLFATITALVQECSSSLSGQQVRPLFDEFLKEMYVRADRREEIDYGAFKMFNDHHKPLRLAAYAGVNVMWKYVGQKLDMKKLCAAARSGMKDPEMQPRTQAYDILKRMTKTNPELILEMLDGLFAWLMSEIKVDLKEIGKTTLSDEEKKPFQNNLRLLCLHWLIFNRLEGAAQLGNFQGLFNALRKKVPQIVAQCEELEKSGQNN